jgi:hypothetical protein
MADEICRGRLQLSRTGPPPTRPIGEHWIDCFRTRHTGLSSVWSRQIEHTRHAAANVDVVQTWSDAVTDLRLAHHYDPGSIYNIDESDIAIPCLPVAITDFTAYKAATSMRERGLFVRGSLMHYCQFPRHLLFASWRVRVQTIKSATYLTRRCGLLIASSLQRRYAVQARARLPSGHHLPLQTPSALRSRICGGASGDSGRRAFSYNTFPIMTTTSPTSISWFWVISFICT